MIKNECKNEYQKTMLFSASKSNYKCVLYKSFTAIQTKLYKKNVKHETSSKTWNNLLDYFMFDIRGLI